MTYWTSDRCAELLTLRAMNLTFREIADIMGRSLGNVIFRHRMLTQGKAIGMPSVRRFNNRGPYRGRTKRIPHLGKVS